MGWVDLMIYLWRACWQQQSGTLHLPRRWRCRLPGIWVETGPRVKSPPGSGDGSDTALLCCTRLWYRPLRRFKEDAAGFSVEGREMLLRLEAIRCWSGAWSIDQKWATRRRRNVALFRWGRLWTRRRDVARFLCWQAETRCSWFMRSWKVFLCRSEAGRLKQMSNPRSEPLHYWTHRI